MPTVPESPVNATSAAPSPMASPTPQNLLMAAASMDKMGKLGVEPGPKLKGAKRKVVR